MPGTVLVVPFVELTLQQEDLTIKYSWEPSKDISTPREFTFMQKNITESRN